MRFGLARQRRILSEDEPRRLDLSPFADNGSVACYNPVDRPQVLWRITEPIAVIVGVGRREHARRDVLVIQEDAIPVSFPQASTLGITRGSNPAPGVTGRGIPVSNEPLRPLQTTLVRRRLPSDIDLILACAESLDLVSGGRPLPPIASSTAASLGGELLYDPVLSAVASGSQLVGIHVLEQLDLGVVGLDASRQGRQVESADLPGSMRRRDQRHVMLCDVARVRIHCG